MSTDYNGLVTIWNERAVRILGLTVQEIPGQPDGTLFTEEDGRTPHPAEGNA